jgi:hypothetical protein
MVNILSSGAATHRFNRMTLQTISYNRSLEVHDIRLLNIMARQTLIFVTGRYVRCTCRLLNIFAQKKVMLIWVSIF